MMKTAKLLFFVFVILITTSVTYTGIHYVDANSPNDPGNGTVSDPFRRIQHGIDAAAPSGDIVQIRPGLYSGPGNRDLNPGGKAVIIRGIDPDDPTTVGTVIIDPNFNGSGFEIISGETSDCIIEGLTIRNADSGYWGGAVICESASPTIRNCIIVNSKGRYGGGIGYYQSDALLLNCTIVNNHCDFSGGGIFIDNSNVTIRNCIIWQNRLDDPENSNGPQIALEYHSNASVSYCNTEDGLLGTSAIESTLSWLQGNIDNEPKFASFDTDAEPDTWDFRLQSQFGRWDNNTTQWITEADTSQCIDAGDPNSNWTEELWPHGGKINIGAYGGTPQASMSASQLGNIADLDHNDTVSTSDFAILAESWLTQRLLLPQDLDRNGWINLADLALFAKNWLWRQQ
ncbi:MAG: hypothetical protein DRP66_09960 [Planctomycetota bacterium]|nr:MAG: hypothetical protein DRP66_09960 [Planctomycetota bacterium]